MYKVLKNEKIADNVYYMQVNAPLVVNNANPGQFVIVMKDESSERIPLTIVDYDECTGIIDLIYQVVGASTYELSLIKDELFTVVGPLGKKSLFVSNDVKDKRFVLVGGGIGIAPLFPQAKYLHEHGAKVDIIYGARNKDLFILSDKLENVCDDITYVTDDGSNGIKGMVTDILSERDKKYDEAIVIGPMVMMKFTCLLTKKMNLKTTVSLNPIMVDGTGMCGACRVIVDGNVKFACVDGPEFDGHLIDFDNAIKRMDLYKTKEGRDYLKIKEGDTHHGGCGNCGE